MLSVVLPEFECFNVSALREVSPKILLMSCIRANLTDNQWFDDNIYNEVLDGS